MYAVKAILKGRLNDIRIFSNEIEILRELVSRPKSLTKKCSEQSDGKMYIPVAKYVFL